MDFTKIYRRIKLFFSAQRVRVMAQYLFFVLVAGFFWLLLTLNNSMRTNIDLPVEITNVPDGITLITDVPSSITVNIKDKGSSLIKYMAWSKPKLKIDFEKWHKNNYEISLNSQQLQGLVRSLFTSTASIDLSVESIVIKYTDLPGKRVPVVFDILVHPNPMYVNVGQSIFSTDSVTIYSNQQNLDEISEVYTYHVEENNLTDTLRRTVAIAPIKGVKIVPREVSAIIPIEQLIRQNLDAPIEVRNLPAGITVLTFPSKAKMSVLTPKSHVNISHNVTAIVDYNDIKLNPQSTKAKVYPGESPGYLSNITLHTDSVDYIIEKK